MKEECCSRERVKIALKSIKEDKKAEVVCPYCNKKYQFSEKDLTKIMMEI